MITLRLDENLEDHIKNASKLLGISKSELIRKSIVDYLEKLEKPNAWEIGKAVFGKYSSGDSNLSQNRKALFKEKIKEKRR